ncbi:MAG TPA: Lpg1974 family pore-forming outer membrane protein [Pirellulales bacterium]
MRCVKILPTGLVALLLAACVSPAHSADGSYGYDTPSLGHPNGNDADPPPEPDSPASLNMQRRYTLDPAGTNTGDKIAPSDSWNNRRGATTTRPTVGRTNVQFHGPDLGGDDSNASALAEPQLLPPNVGANRSRNARATIGQYQPDGSISTVRIGSVPMNNPRGSGYRPAAYQTGDDVPGNSVISGRAGSVPVPDNVPPPEQLPPSANAPTTRYPDYHVGGRGANSMPMPPDSDSMWQNDDMHLGDEASNECMSNCNNCCWNPCGCPGWFAAAEYLYVRPTFSEQQAFLKRTTVVDPNTEDTTVTDTVVHQNYDYTSSVRTYLGYRFACGDELRFTYWNLTSDYNITSGRANSDGSVIFAGHLELVTQVPGQRIVSEGGINANVYDIEYAKCSCGSSCCDPCHCCPPWTLKYFAGIRVADIRRDDNNLLLNRDDEGDRAAFISADFIGAGPRVGIEGRRFFHHGCTSLYARGNIALLLGEYDLKQTRKTPPSDPSVTENYFDTHDRMIPEIDIELGGTFQWSQHVSFSAGYMFQAWVDLGAFEQIEGNIFLNPIDDANIMAFDGLVAKMEITF